MKTTILAYTLSLTIAAIAVTAVTLFAVAVLFLGYALELN